MGGVRDAVAKALMGIKAYHGSPHSFDKFDLSKIGTGEGAQAYGHGLYFAGNENVARGYRNALTNYTRDDLLQVAPLLPDKYRGSMDGPRMIMDDIQKSMQFGDIKDYGDYLKRYDVDPDLVAAHKKAAELLKARGHMYEVNIGADPNTMLDWDKPLAQQPIVAARMPSAMLDAAQKEAQSRAYAATTKRRSDQLWGIAKDPYQAPGEFFGGGVYNAEKAAKQMADAGIPGVKYLDAGSRGGGAGTSNYVVSDPAINIDILRKYGVVGAPAGALAADQMGSTFDQRYYGEQP